MKMGCSTVEPVKVLYVYGDTLRFGGIERFMLNYFSNMDSNVVHVDFAVQGNEKSVFDKQILSAGSKIFHLPKPGRNPLQFYLELRKVILEGQYKIVHAHCDAMNYRIMRYTKKMGVPVRISHSHNTAHILTSRMKFLFYEYCRKHIARYATECWACSEAAGDWLYGKRPFTVVHNAIVLDQFAFNPKVRENLRKKFQIADDEIVLGHVGRFHEQKNHEFLIDLMKLIQERSDGRKYRLLLVGSGELQDQIQERALVAGVRDNIIFTGSVPNPQDYYNMMDMFVLPSLFEGYPLVVTEAEANGLKCIASENVSREVNVLDMVQFRKLELNEWLDCLESMDLTRRTDSIESLRESGFEISLSAKELQKEYVRLYRKAVK